MKIRAIGLLSGGLDSTLAVRLMHDLGIDVQAVNFHTGFCFTDTRRETKGKKNPNPTGGPSDALSSAANLGIKIDITDISDGYLDIVHNPKYGYGKNVNPCIDCRINMFKIAAEKMREFDAKFVFTGEVLAQRPMSQHYDQLGLIAKQAGLEDLLLRPLSAKLLPPTLPEREGWVDRDKLFGFHGRSRKDQMALAEKYGIHEYLTPAGGCCTLTDPAYGKKVKDLWNHTDKNTLQWDDYLLMKTGRHLRVNDDLKIIVGRDEGENHFLGQFKGQRISVEPEQIPGPTALIDKEPDAVEEDMISIAASIVARYSDRDSNGDAISILIKRGKEADRVIQAKPYTVEEVRSWLIT